MQTSTLTLVVIITVLLALANVIDAAEHRSVGEFLVDVLDAGLGTVGEGFDFIKLSVFLMKISIVDARALDSIPLESEIRAVALDSDLVVEESSIVQISRRAGLLGRFPRRLPRRPPPWLPCRLPHRLLHWLFRWNHRWLLCCLFHWCSRCRHLSWVARCGSRSRRSRCRVCRFGSRWL